MDDKFRATQRNTFSLHLERSGKRLTPERVFILDTALGMKSHFTANDLRQAMEGGNMRVSRATLFNTLPLMTECGVLRRFSGARGVAPVLGGAASESGVCRVRENVQAQGAGFESVGRGTDLP